MNCKCGHGISKHDMGGCQHTVRKTDDFDLVCKCGLTPDAIAESHLAALREAGEKMARASYVFKSVATFRETDGNCYHCGADETQTHSPKCKFDIFQKELAAALEAWEAANK